MKDINVREIVLIEQYALRYAAFGEREYENSQNVIQIVKRETDLLENKLHMAESRLTLCENIYSNLCRQYDMIGDNPEHQDERKELERKISRAKHNIESARSCIFSAKMELSRMKSSAQELCHSAKHFGETILRATQEGARELKSIIQALQNYKTAK